MSYFSCEDNDVIGLGYQSFRPEGDDAGLRVYDNLDVIKISDKRKSISFNMKHIVSCIENHYKNMYNLTYDDDFDVKFPSCIPDFKKEEHDKDTNVFRFCVSTKDSYTKKFYSHKFVIRIYFLGEYAELVHDPSVYLTIPSIILKKEGRTVITISDTFFHDFSDGMKIDSR